MSESLVEEARQEISFVRVSWPTTADLLTRLADRVEELEAALRVIGYDERRGWHGMDSMREFARQALSPPMDAGRKRE